MAAPEDEAAWARNARGAGLRDLPQHLERLRADLTTVVREVESIRQELGRLRGDVTLDARGGDKRGFQIERLDERLKELSDLMQNRLHELSNAMQARFAEAIVRVAAVEKDYVTKQALKDEVAPIWKWTGVAGVAIIGAVVTYVVSILQGKSH